MASNRIRFNVMNITIHVICDCIISETLKKFYTLSPVNQNALLSSESRSRNGVFS